MERPSGLGRSLEDVLDSLAPTDSDPSAPGRVLFEPEDIEQQLDSLMGEIRELRERVQHLVALVPGDPDTEGRDLEGAKLKGAKLKGAKSKRGKHKGVKKSHKAAKKLGKGAKKTRKAKHDKAGTKARPQRAAA
jgi:hypothetical protein